jgi:deazaflavin-dependent oxidoreductase (nitroreductase family)
MKAQLLLPNRMRFLNKSVFNRVTLRFAGSSHSPISLIRHVGRRSRSAYTTPVIAVPTGNRFVFALPYGRKVDWYRNILATGRGVVVWHGRQYPVENPEPLLVGAGKAALPFALRCIVRILGSRYFMQMDRIQEAQ